MLVIMAVGHAEMHRLLWYDDDLPPEFTCDLAVESMAELDETRIVCYMVDAGRSL
jgi:hypothetical protein